MFRAVTLAGAVILGLMLPTLAEAAYTTGWVNIRSGPGMKHPVVMVVWPGTPFTVQGCSRHWCKVNYGGVRGWISAAHVVGR